MFDIPMAGLGQDKPVNAGGVHFVTALNLDFGKHGAVRGRPCYQRASGGYWIRNVDTNGQAAPQNQATLAATGYTSTAMFTQRDRNSERAGLVTNGRIFTYEDNAWVDRGGAGSYKATRLCDVQQNLAPGYPPSGNFAVVQPCTYDFAPGASTGGANPNLALLSSAGERDTDLAAPAVFGPGCGARCGTTTALLYIQTGTNNLYFVTRSNGGRALAASVLLATDAATPISTGDNPCICCDFDSANFFVTYKTTLNTHTVKLLKVSTAGSIVTTQTITTGAGTCLGHWVCNSSVADNRVIVAYADSGTGGITTAVYDQTLTTQGININHNNAKTAVGPMVVGAAQGGVVWYGWKYSDGSFVIGNRSTTIVANSDFETLNGFQFSLAGPSWAYSLVNGPVFYPMHQPVFVNGRVIFNLAILRMVDPYASGPSNSVSDSSAQVCTWYALDVTDLNRIGTTTGTRRWPAMVARGDLESTALPWNPQGAIVGASGTSWRFPSVDFRLFSASPAPGCSVLGFNGALGLNEVSVMAPAFARIGDTTVLTGSVARGLTRGPAYEVGFPYLGSPPVFVTATSGGAFLAGSYTVYACWKWVDEAGQVHRSAPSPGWTLSLTSNQEMIVDVGNYLLTDRDFSVVGDRNGGVFVEIYITDVNQPAGAPAYLAATTPGPLTTYQQAITVNGPSSSFTNLTTLYTTGGVMAVRTVKGDGGVATIGSRCFLSDGANVYASRLGAQGANEALSFNNDGPLVISVPPAAGRVVALSAIDEKLIIGCERGVYEVVGSGPNDQGQGQGFTTPVRISDLGVAGSRSMIYTPKGVIFYARNTNVADATSGGLWLINRGVQCEFISWAARDSFAQASTGAAADLAFIPERELLVCRVPGASSQGGVYSVLDFRVGAWSDWNVHTDLVTSIAPVAGYLWSCGTHVGGYTLPPNTGADQTSGTENVTMQLVTGNIPTVNAEGIPWGRVRSLIVYGDLPAASHALTGIVQMDDSTTQFTTTFSALDPTGSVGTWPSDRYAPEWRLPMQRGATVKVNIAATPAVATLVKAVLDNTPVSGRTPAKVRQ